MQKFFWNKQVRFRHLTDFNQNRKKPYELIPSFVFLLFSLHTHTPTSSSFHIFNNKMEEWLTWTSESYFICHTEQDISALYQIKKLLKLLYRNFDIKIAWWHQTAFCNLLRLLSVDCTLLVCSYISYQLNWYISFYQNQKKMGSK